jgi:hypothetical protein
LAGWLVAIKLQASHPAHQASSINDKYANDSGNNNHYDGLEFKRVPYLERRKFERNSCSGLKS